MIRLLSIAWFDIARAVAALAFAYTMTYCLSVQAQDSADEQVSIGPEAAWIEQVTWSNPAQNESGKEGTGVRYLLIDQQVNLAEHSRYSHTVRLLENESSVQNNGSVSFTFEPSFQQLVLNKVLIHRGDETIDQLSMDRVKLIQPEDDLPIGIYSGEHRALLIVEGLRIGDVLEIASSTVGMNPVIGDDFADTFSVAYGVPVESRFLRVATPPNKKITWRNHGHAITPTETEKNGLVELTWKIPSQDALDYEDYVPYDVIQTPFVEVSTFPTWQSVAIWASELYPSDNLSEEMEEMIRQWRDEFESTEQRAQAAIRFVQDEIRYFGIEVGPESFRPAKSKTTLERRYGDCKGKTLLLCDILTNLGIKALPVLVRSPTTELAGRLPSPFAFNHVIAQIELDYGQRIWVDATRTLQRGPLSKLPVGRFGSALVISEDSQKLTRVISPASDVVTDAVTKQFYVSDYDQPVEMTIDSTYRGASAESIRSYFARTAKDAIEKEYLNYYAEDYPGIRDCDLSISDDENQNIVRVSERYQIDEFFSSDDGELPYAFSYPETLEGQLTNPSTRLRTHPLRISHPTKVSHTTIFHVHEDWPEWTDSDAVVHNAFRIDWRGRCVGRKVTFDYELETLADRVPADEVEGYLAKLDEVDDFLGDYVEQQQAFGLASINWLLLLLAAFYAIMLSAFAIWMLRRKRKGSTDEPTERERGQAISGWLILIAIGVSLTPIRLLAYFIGDFESYFDLTYWQQCTTPGGPLYHPITAPVLIFELLSQVSMIILSVALLYLFFSKRRGFPKCYVAFTLSCMALAIFWLVIAKNFPDSLGLDVATAQNYVGRLILPCLIWVPYMLLSKRVKNTFVR